MRIVGRDEERTAVAALVFVGAAVRILFDRRWIGAPNSEAGNVARSLANGRGFADAYFAGQGPTAHLMPVTPLIAATVYRAVGSGWAGGAVLLALSVAISIGCFLLGARAARLLGAARGVVLAGLAFVLLVPIHETTETMRWQVWDGGLGKLLLLATLVIVLAAERGLRMRGEHLFRALLPALALLTNPIAGLAAMLCALLFLWRDRRRAGVIRPLFALGAAIALVFAPWVVRNARVLGRPIVTRDNLGLELAVGNDPAAVDPADPAAAFDRRLAAIHPRVSEAARRAMRAAGGEGAYADGLGAETRAWMAAHPAAVARIWARHLADMLFPRPWMFRAEHERVFAGARAVIAALVSAGDLVEIAMLLAIGERGARYPLIAVGVVAGLTMPFQPVLRYCWLLYPLLAMLAAGGVARMVARIVATRRVPESGMA